MYYKATFTDGDGYEYYVRWDIIDHDTEDESECCDWDVFRVYDDGYNFVYGVVYAKDLTDRQQDKFIEVFYSIVDFDDMDYQSPCGCVWIYEPYQMLYGDSIKEMAVNFADREFVEMYGLEVSIEDLEHSLGELVDEIDFHKSYDAGNEGFEERLCELESEYKEKEKELDELKSRLSDLETKYK